MPNQRSENQKLIAVPVNKELLAKVDDARGGVNRSAWIRNAIADLLKKLGYEVPDSLVDPPDRTGKGGPRKEKATSSKDHGSRGLMVAEGEAEYEVNKKKKI